MNTRIAVVHRERYIGQSVALAADSMQMHRAIRSAFG
jgi:hypothetical protein